MTETSAGRGKFTPVPFTFTYNAEEGVEREVTWMGRGRKPRELLLQIAHEKNTNDGVSATEQALESRNPRWEAEEQRKEELAKIRAEKREEREKLAAERAARKAEREARKAAQTAQGLQAEA